MWASWPSSGRGEGTTTDDETPIVARSVAPWGWRHLHPLVRVSRAHVERHLTPLGLAAHA
eukprot:1540126-Pleurochrysis_carterae.AAC.2